MTTTRREQMRQIMMVAHSWKRQIGCSMAEAMRTAWRAAKIKMAAPVKVHRVKPYSRPAVSPVAATAFVVGRYNARRSAWMGSKIATW